MPASSAAAPATTDSLDLLLGQDQYTHWVHEFELRGRVYTLVHGGPMTINSERAIVRVFTPSGAMRDITVRANARLRIVSRRGGPDGTSYPEGSTPWGSWTPSR